MTVETTMYHPLEVLDELEKLEVGGEDMNVRDHITARGLYQFMRKVRREGEEIKREYEFKLDITRNLGCTVKRTK